MDYTEDYDLNELNELSLDGMVKEYTRDWYGKNRESILIQRRDYYANLSPEDKHALLKRNAEYYQNLSSAEKEIRNARRRELYKANLTKNRAYMAKIAQARYANLSPKEKKRYSDKVNGQQKAKYHTDPDYRAQMLANQCAIKLKMTPEEKAEYNRKMKERVKKSRAKKRFETKTGSVIMGLLNGIAQSKMK